MDREDYEEAKQLKADIEQLRAAGEAAALGRQKAGGAPPAGGGAKFASQPLARTPWRPPQRATADDEPVSLPLDAPERAEQTPAATILARYAGGPASGPSVLRISPPGFPSRSA